jgi:hypothetical protein
MNPYQEISNGLSKNSKSPFFGRYRFCFNQVYPFREPLFDRLVIKLKNTEQVKSIFDKLPKHIQIIHFFKQNHLKGNQQWEIDFFEDKDAFLVFEMLSDVKYLALENIYFSLLELAPYMEDCHFFIYSSGDDDHRWIDEFKSIWVKLLLKKIIAKMRYILDAWIFILTELKKDLKDTKFKKFTLFQLYDRIHFWIKDLSKYPTKDIVKKSSLHYTYKEYLIKLYSIDEECSDLYSLNNKYNFASMM